MRVGKLVILLAEDEEKDAFFVREATRRCPAGHQLEVVQEGQEAVHYLLGEGKFADRDRYPLPQLILTDLKMPGMNGYELLGWLREHPPFALIPVIVLSGSQLDDDVREAYRLGANCYLCKPTSLSELVELLKITYDFWTRCESLPLLNTNQETY